jgi:hypothetical protein
LLREAFLKVATIKKTPVLKREELYQGLIEPGWGAGLLNPAQGGERNILYMTLLTLKSFLSERNASFCSALTVWGSRVDGRALLKRGRHNLGRGSQAKPCARPTRYIERYSGDLKL